MGSLKIKVNRFVNNYKFKVKKGLSRFLHSERAKLFANYAKFTLGTGAGDPGIESYKKELGPSREEEYFYLLTGGKF